MLIQYQILINFILNHCSLFLLAACIALNLYFIAAKPSDLGGGLKLIVSAKYNFQFHLSQYN